MPQPTTQANTVAIFIPSFGDGGVERMLVNLARGLAALGTPVDFLVQHRRIPYLDLLPAEVRVFTLETSKPRRQLQWLCRYLRAEQPAVLLSAKTKADEVAFRAKARCPGGTRFFLRPGTTFSARLDARPHRILHRWRTRARIRRLYSKADGIIAVSLGVADDLVHFAGVAAGRIRVIRNPNITPEFYRLAEQPPNHPWFAPGAPPVILGAGGLRRQKDFPTLLRAFARVREQLPCRLLILGEGRLRQALLDLARTLGIGDDMELHGFAPNPYPYLRRSALFVLSSLWEGSPNVLTEALALGTPVVSTDCPSGPREILQAGRFGPLVPVGDAEALAQAIIRTFAHPLDATTLQSATTEYTMENSARQYLRAFGLSGFS